MNKQRGLMISAVSKRIIIARDSHHSSYKSLNEIVSQIKEEHGEIPDCNPDTRKGCVWVTPDYTITYNDQSMGRTIVIESK